MKISDLLRLYFGKSTFKLLPISFSFLYTDAVSTHIDNIQKISSKNFKGT